MGFATDFDAFKRAGIPGLNFAFIDDASVYHSKLDTPEHVSAATLQDEGDTTLALLRRFGNMNLDKPASGNITYFNLAGRYTVTYGNIPAVALTLLILGLVFFDLFKEGFKARNLP